MITRKGSYVGFWRYNYDGKNKYGKAEIPKKEQNSSTDFYMSLPVWRLGPMLPLVLISNWFGMSSARLTEKLMKSDSIFSLF